MLRWTYAGAASLALVACGLVHGLWTDRWRPAAEPAQAAARLDDIPLEIGDWQGQVQAVKTGQAGEGVAGYIQRHYVNRQTGAMVTLALVCGRHGPVSIHTPEACYGASGYQVGPKSRVSVGESRATFWKTDATLTKVAEEKRVRVFWAWNAGQGWTASADPRVAFAHCPVLHKLYVVRGLGGSGDAAKGEPCEEFLKVLLPELERTLFAPGS